MDTKTQKQREDDLRKSLNYAYLKAGTPREAIDKFKYQAIKLLNSLQANETEDFYKNCLSDFLKETYYKSNHYINTKGKNDLVIHNDKKSTSSVGVIIEVKRPSNKSEMISCDNLNKKSLQELVLYYCRERITHKNLHIKNLIVTNINEWFIFNARVFESCFAENKQLVKDFTEFESGRLAGHKTSSFYDAIAYPIIELCKEKLEFTYFNLANYQTLLENTNKENDKALIPLFKILSPEHLLKLSFSNDANSLNQEFYNELLHIIGLEEIKESGKKLIKRKEKNRHSASFLEQTLCYIKNRGEITQEQPLFEAAIELSITWINRILFLKLLEAQLMTYHKNDKLYQFFTIEKLTGFSDLNHLFFDVLAIKEENRDEDSKKRLSHIPYLNSSLFEETELENKTLDISKLRRLPLPILSTTVLKNEQGHQLTGELDVLSYLFSFLEAYDFSNDSKEDIKEHNKSLITASVLGLIFEKINGYKDGSFFTPSMITMTMSRETMRLAVLQKFNELKGFECQTFDDLKSTIKINSKENRKEANAIVNSLKVCDPAVGSGHFLVSVLNEFIAIKSELGILVYHEDENYTGLSGWKITVENDELEITRRDNDTIKFEYYIDSKESQKIQKTLFHEKQKIIENCLFGVDINPNSVKICRLRLWIELLKNAYYNDDKKLETLPNIDINIQCGNSLISRFSLDADLKSALKRSHVNIDDYKKAFHSYQKAKSKSEKKEMERLIKSIKENFYAEAYENDPNKKLLTEKIAAKYSLTNTSLIEETVKEQIVREKALQKIELEITRLNYEIENFRNNPLYKNAFEWRFEFPEALNDDGDFIGFDVIIGNPPYGIEFSSQEKALFKKEFSDVHVRTPDSFNYFISKSFGLIKQNWMISFIVPNNLFFQTEYEKARKLLLSKKRMLIAINLGDGIFHSPTVPSCIFVVKNTHVSHYDFFYSDARTLFSTDKKDLNLLEKINIDDILNTPSYVFGVSNKKLEIIKKIEKQSCLIDTIALEVACGISSGGDKVFRIHKNLANNLNLEKNLLKPILVGCEINKYNIENTENFVIYSDRDLNIENFDNVHKYLKSFKPKLENRSECKSGILPWFSLNRHRYTKLFTDKKIIMRQTSDSIRATYDDKSFFVLDSILVLKLKNESEFSYKFVLAILNCKLTEFIYKNLTQEEGRIFAQVKPKNVRKLYIPKLLSQEQKPFITLVNKILKAKKAGQDTHDLEAQIDTLVYALYGLNEAEIALVAGEK